MTLAELYYSFPTLYRLSHVLPPGLFWRHRATDVILTELLASKMSTGKILEIGCGSGDLLRKIAKLFPDNECLGIDSSDAMIAYASRNKKLVNLHFLVLDFFRIRQSPFELRDFGTVVSVNTWAFFPLHSSVRLLRDVVKPGGRFVAITYSDAAWSRIHSRVLSSVLRQRLYLHHPWQFVSALNHFGFEARYAKINRFEGSYLVNAVFQE
jgi:SAM-dependent methyltransferase